MDPGQQQSSPPFAPVKMESSAQPSSAFTPVKMETTWKQEGNRLETSSSFVTPPNKMESPTPSAAELSLEHKNTGAESSPANLSPISKMEVGLFTLLIK